MDGKIIFFIVNIAIITASFYYTISIFTGVLFWTPTAWDFKNINILKGTRARLAGLGASLLCFLFFWIFYSISTPLIKNDILNILVILLVGSSISLSYLRFIKNRATKQNII